MVSRSRPPGSAVSKVVISYLESVVLREAEIDAAVARVEPAGGHELAAGEEVPTLGAVRVGVPEQRALPAAEAVVGGGNGDRHVDADHAILDLILEPPRGAAVVGED